jgi:signal transduction histidine kinase/ActR/RegA family two-component response regulator
MNLFRNARPLRTQLLLLAGVGLLPLAILGAWGLAILLQYQTDEVERSTLAISRALASAVESEHLATITVLNGLADVTPLRDGNIQGFYAVAKSAVQARKNWTGMELLDKNGKVLFRTSEPYGESKPEEPDSASLKTVIETRKPVVGSLQRGESGQLEFDVRVPVLRQGELAYVVTAVVKPDRIVDILSRQKGPKDWVMSVFDGAGVRVARSRDHERTVGTRAMPSLAKLLSQDLAEGTGITSTIEGETVFTGYSRVNGLDWMVVAGAPQSNMIAVALTSGTTFAMGVLASLIACVLLALYQARRILDPIEAIGSQAALLREGKPVSIQASEIPELDDMGHALAAASADREALIRSQAEALQRAEEASRVKDEFLAVLGHELRNPLAPIVSAMHLMDMKADPSTAKERRIVRRQVDHMKRLVDDLLDISRVTRRQLEIRREAVDIGVVVERSLEAVLTVAPKLLESTQVTGPQRATFVLGDELRLVQVFSNLLTNAIKFDTSRRLVVSIYAREAEEEGKSEVTVSIRDHGTGMDPAVVARIFEPFYQAPQSIERSSGGLGLGLAIVKGIVEAHGGRVTASSAGVGLGSTVSVVLPIMNFATPAAQPVSGEHSARAEASAEANNGARLLVVDDNRDAADSTADLLKLSGFEVAVVYRPSDALALLADFKPDLALLDIGLPEMDGYELARRIRAASGSESCRLVALTGYGKENDKKLAREAGFDRHLSKPVEPGALLAAIDELLVKT